MDNIIQAYRIILIFIVAVAITSMVYASYNLYMGVFSKPHSLDVFCKGNGFNEAYYIGNILSSCGNVTYSGNTFTHLGNKNVIYREHKWWFRQ